MTVAVVGYASLDRPVLVDRLPGPDRTAVVRRRLRRVWPAAGGIAHAVVQLAEETADPRPVSWVADDPDGRVWLTTLQAAGVDTAGIAVSGTRSPTSTLVYDDQAGMCLFDPGDVDSRLNDRQRDVIAASDWTLIAVGPTSATLQAVEAAPDDAGVAVAVKADPDAWTVDLARRLVVRCDLLSMSEGEAAFIASLLAGEDLAAEDLAGEDGETLDELAWWFGRDRPQPALVIVTRGAQGVRYRRGGDTWAQVAAPPVRTTDTTGAGDTVLAGVLAGLIDGRDDEQAVRSGMTAASRMLRNRAEEQT